MYLAERSFFVTKPRFAPTVGMNLLARLRSLPRVLSLGLLVLGSGAATYAVSHARNLGGECCGTGAACCKPGAACCNNHH
jgi:hypothetical protein